MAGGKKDNKSKGDSKGSKNSSKAEEGSSSKLKPATSINVRHILCEKYSRKEDALAKLNAGAKFDEVAREFSEDKARQGGSLGWQTRGALHGDFEKLAYELSPSTTGNPKWAECKTSHGYHVIMVEGRK